MARLRGVRRLFRLPTREDTVEGEVVEEIAFHLESRVAELVAGGLPERDARLQAEREFGDVRAARAELAQLGRRRVRHARRADRLDAIGHELRLAGRGLLRAPGFTAAVVVMLALGIGVNAAMFGLADRLLLSPPPHVEAADELVRVMYRSTPRWDGVLRTEATMPYADYVLFRDEATGFSAVGAYSPPNVAALGRGVDAGELRVSTATASFFTVLGVTARHGRFFSEAEGREPRGENVVVLSHEFWRRQFGADVGVLGRTLEIAHTQYTVIGVAPPGFHGIDLNAVDAWIPISASPAAQGDWETTRSMAWLRIVARLAPGVSREAAEAQATAVYLPQYPTRYEDDATARIVLGSIIAARAPAVGTGTPQRSGRIALWLLGVSGVVLLIACLNVANLLLARGLRRRRELGVRLALGVSRRRIAFQTVAESLLIAAAGAALGVLLAHWAGHFARVLLVPEFDWSGSSVDGRVLAFAGAIAAASAVLAALLPTVYAARAEAIALLGLGGGKGATTRRSLLRTSLVVVQAALSVLLLVGAGLFVRSLHNARTLSLGFDAERVVLLQWHRGGLDWSDERLDEVYTASLERLQALPEVERAALSMTAPFFGAAGATIRLPGRDSVPTPPGMFGYMYNAVTPDYFAALGTRLVRGRAFDERDVPGSAPVAIITQSMADFLWPGEDVLGKCFVHAQRADAPCREIVGVVEPIRYRNVEEAPEAIFFLPFTQRPPWMTRVLVARTRGSPEHVLVPIRQALHAMEPGLPHVQATLLRDRIEPQLQPWRLGATLFTTFGALALLLAGLGLYGVIAYDVAQRTREVGVRIALGARARNIARLVLGDAVRVVAAGLVLGLAVAAWAAPRVEALLFEVGAHDQPVYGTVALLLLVVGGAAALVPMGRALRVAPTVALRED